MSAVRKFEPPFAELLESTLELALSRNLNLILYIGYLGNANQADVILELVKTYKSIIRTIITDPVCGDHGRKYVPDEVIAKWPAIIQLSDIVFPNLTEIKLLTGHDTDDGQPEDVFINQFKERFPFVKLVVTSIKPTENTIGIQTYSDEPYSYSLPLLPQNFGGSGDAFLSLFILNHYYKTENFNDSLKSAVDQTYRIIKNSIDHKSSELLLTTPI